MQALLKETNLAQINEDLGIVVPLEFPFNLFLNLKHLANPSIRFVYFYIYSLGKKRIVIWGVYDESTQKFIIDGSCKYQTLELANLIKTWKNYDFTYVGNTVKNRPREVLSGYFNKPQMNYPQYLKGKFILAYFQKKISQEELLSRYPYALSEIYNTILAEDKDAPFNFDLYLDECLFSLEKTLSQYEQNINLIDSNREISEIVNRFYDSLKYG